MVRPATDMEFDFRQRYLASVNDTDRSPDVSMFNISDTGDIFHANNLKCSIAQNLNAYGTVANPFKRCVWFSIRHWNRMPIISRTPAYPLSFNF